MENSLDSNDIMPRSAFINVMKTSKTRHGDTSPPLSPTSSVSSAEDLSLNNTDLQNSLNTTPKTPSNFMNAFPTPPSGGSISLLPPHLNDLSINS